MVERERERERESLKVEKTRKIGGKEDEAKVGKYNTTTRVVMTLMPLPD